MNCIFYLCCKCLFTNTKKYVKRILCLNENLLDLNAKKYCFKMQKAFRLYIDKSIAFNHTKKCVLTQQCFALKSNIFCDYRNTFAITFSEKMEAFFMFNEINKNWYFLASYVLLSFWHIVPFKAINNNTEQMLVPQE